MGVHSNGKSDRAKDLTFRLASQHDLPLLRQMRIECGWGSEKLEERFPKPDYIYCIFSKEIEGHMEDVGMGGWCLAEPYDGKLPNEENLASRSDKIVYLTALFIRKRYQGHGLGGAAMNLLEQAARDIHGADYATLDTVKYHSEQGSHGDLVEDQTRPSETGAWYKSRGYQEFREPIPLFLHPTPEDPDFKLTAIFFKKKL